MNAKSLFHFDFGRLSIPLLFSSQCKDAFKAVYYRKLPTYDAISYIKTHNTTRSTQYFIVT